MKVLGGPPHLGWQEFPHGHGKIAASASPVAACCHRHRRTVPANAASGSNGRDNLAISRRQERQVNQTTSEAEQLFALDKLPQLHWLARRDCGSVAMSASLRTGGAGGVRMPVQ